MTDEKNIATHRILVHSCCAPCSIYPLDRLGEEGFLATGFFYNPNIHPFTEFDARRAAVVDYYGALRLPLIVDAAYDVEEFIREVFHPGEERCVACVRLRLRAAADRARALGVKSMTTTLLYSIYQDHDAISRVGREEAHDAGIEFYYEDFRTGWHFGQRRARELSIYRQKYCGCIFSEQERYVGKIAALREEKRRA